MVQLQHGMHRARRESFEYIRQCEQQEKAEMEEMRQKMVQPLIDAAKVPSLAYTYGGSKLARKIAAYVLAVQRGDVKAKLDIQPTDTFGEGPVKAPRNRNGASATKPKPLAHKKMKCAHQSKPTQPHSGELKVNQSDSLSQTKARNDLPQTGTNHGHSCVTD